MVEEEHTKHEAYLEGRLLGLNQLVSILRDAMSSKHGADAEDIVKSIVMHISDETENIIDEFREVHGEHPLLAKATKDVKAKIVEPAKAVEKEKEEPAAPALKKQVVAADELMKKLLDLQKQAAEARGEQEEG